jgi:hypothetical protein
MPAVIGRDELRKLTGDGAQLAEAVRTSSSWAWRSIAGLR